MTENDDEKKEDDNKPDKKLSNKKLNPKNQSVHFTNVNDTDEENNEEVCASQYNFAFNTHISTSEDPRHLIFLTTSRHATYSATQNCWKTYIQRQIKLI